MTTTLAPNVGALKQRDTLRLCTAGSVDDGNSTFVGRLLYDTKSVLADQVESMERTSTDRGFDGMDLSLLVDGLRAEREQGITIDVAYRYFDTERRKYIVADCPGHEQYTRNMATGASTADLAVVLVDARKLVGILVEAPYVGDVSRVVVGFGVNYDLTTSELPVPHATSAPRSRPFRCGASRESTSG